MVQIPHQTPGSAPIEDTRHRPRLVLRFALYTGAVLFAAALGTFWVIEREVSGPAQRTVETQSRAVAQQSLRSQLLPGDFAAAVSPARRRRLDRLFRTRILIGGVVGGRLVRRDGTITYAGRHQLIGTAVVYRSRLRAAFGGHFQRRFTHIDTWRGRRHVQVLQTLLPVRFAHSRRTIGVLELDQDYTGAADSIDEARKHIAIVLGLALLLLYAALFPILRRVSRQLEAPNRRLRELLQERGRLLERERAVRSEAEAAQRLVTEQNDRLRELDRMKDEFISLVSHELRTPLTSIRGYLELLLDDGTLSDQHRRFLAVVDRNSERLLDLVSDLLFLAQIEAGKVGFTLGPVDLDDVVHECIETSSPAADRLRVELTAHTEAVPSLQADRARLAQVLDNLVSNALKSTPSGGRVDVRLRAEDGAALIEVQDTGLGIAEDEQTHLFERFFRSARATEQAIPGSGLGLTISKAIVERHGGKIELESSESAGTTARVRLPLSTRVALPLAGSRRNQPLHGPFLPRSSDIRAAHTVLIPEPARIPAARSDH
jgi:signal transduction histidine kinase